MVGGMLLLLHSSSNLTFFFFFLGKGIVSSTGGPTFATSFSSGIREFSTFGFSGPSIVLSSCDERSESRKGLG